GTWDSQSWRWRSAEGAELDTERVSPVLCVLLSDSEADPARHALMGCAFPSKRLIPHVSKRTNGACPDRPTLFFLSGSASFLRRSLKRKIFAPIAKVNRVRRTVYGTRISAYG